MKWSKREKLLVYMHGKEDVEFCDVTDARKEYVLDSC